MYQVIIQVFNTRHKKLFIHNKSLRSNVISYLFFKAQACSVTEVVVDDAKIVRKFLTSCITSTHVPTVELFIKCFMTQKTTGIENRHRRTGMLMTTILLVLLGPQCFTQDLRSCATRLLLSFAHSCFFIILPGKKH